MGRADNYLKANQERIGIWKENKTDWIKRKVREAKEGKERTKWEGLGGKKETGVVRVMTRVNDGM